MTGMDVFDLETELSQLDDSASRLAAYRDDVSRAAAGAAGGSGEAVLRAKGRALSNTITNLETAVLWGRRALNGGATGGAQGAVPLDVARSAVMGQTGINTGSGMADTLGTPAGAFSVKVGTDGDPFGGSMLNVRADSLVADLVRAAIERLVPHESGIWALHRQGVALTENTAAEAGIVPGDELLLLRVGE